MDKKLFGLLEHVKKHAPGNIFTGVGIVVYDSLVELPYFMLNANSSIKQDLDLFETILESSLATNIHHDGFSLINQDFKISHKNVYFAPPINNDIDFDNSKGYGTRYIAAMLGSKINGVLLTAVVSNSYGIVIFKNGKVVMKEICD